MRRSLLRLSALDELEDRVLLAVTATALPAVPAMDPATVNNLRMIAQVGRLNGLQQNAFIKVGDSNTYTSNYMYGLADPATSNISSLTADDQATINYFRTPIPGTGTNSFNRASTATYPGWTIRHVHSVIEAELDATKAAIATIMIGTMDIALVPQTVYTSLLIETVDKLIARGVIPVLSTIPPLEYQGALSDAAAIGWNQVIANIADQKRIPLLNLWSGLQSIPNHGLGDDSVHLNVSPNGAGSLAEVDRAFGQNYREYITIEALTQIRKQVFEYNPQLAASQLNLSWTPLQSGQAVFATGTEAGQVSVVTVFDAATGNQLAQALPFGPSFLGGVRVAVGDLNGDGVPDILAAAGQTGGPAVIGYSGVDGHPLFAFFAYEPAFRGGVNVAIGDTASDGYNDIIVGAGPSGGPRVRVFDPRTLAVKQDFFAFEPSLRGGVTVAAGNINGPVIVVGAGDGGAPIVKIFEAQTGADRGLFAAYDINERAGVNLAVGDLNGDGQDEIVTGSRNGGAPHVKVFDASNFTNVSSFFAGDPNATYGVHVGVISSRGSKPASIVAAPSNPGSQPIRLFDASGNPRLTPNTLNSIALLTNANVSG